MKWQDGKIKVNYSTRLKNGPINNIPLNQLHDTTFTTKLARTTPTISRYVRLTSWLQ